MPDLIEATRRSKVTFAASKERGRQMIEPRSMYLDGLQRIREPVSRSKAGVQGKVADVANGRSRHAESQNELKAFRVLMATARSDVWQEQPFVLEYQHEEDKASLHAGYSDRLGRTSGSRGNQRGLRG